MSITLLRLSADELHVSLAEAMRYMGVTGDAPDVLSLAEKLLTELRAAVVPKACFEEYPIIRGEGSINVGTAHTDSAALMKNLEGCSTAVVFAATLGVGADRLVAKYSRIAPSKAVVLGALGSAMIESFCDAVCENIGKRTKPRFSPGYGGFDLLAQMRIAEMLECEKRIGLYFTESLMMIPEKSVTAIVGICDE